MRSAGYDVRPLWARLAHAYVHAVPNHRGKRSLLRLVCRLAARFGRPFIWQMRNGALLAVSPAEGLAPYATVGWTCFLEGTWEPDLERCLRDRLAPGDVAYDIGANLGYFTAVMAQAVGERGRVIAFEPVRETFARLEMSCKANGFSGVTTLPIALGEADGELRLAVDLRAAGEASAFERPDRAETDHVDVPIRRLDDLVRESGFPLPSLMKIDVEGYELAVLRGSRRILLERRPTLLIEVNGLMSRLAGWTPADLSGFLRGVAPYRFSLLGADGPRPVDLDALQLAPEAYVDILAEAE